jgi:colanic acid/amylovoran biosynthesis glycosyltransferase
MKRQILIFTDNYPFGKSEPFFDAELKFIESAFEKVIIFPFETGKEGNRRPIPGKTEVLKPVFREVKNKPDLIFKGLFNTSIFFSLLKEGMRSRVWRSAKLFRIWATHFLVIRSLLSEIKQRNLLNFFNSFDILYFYWGLRWSQVLPFLPEVIRSKIVVRFHGSDLYEHTNNNYIPWRYEQLTKISKAVAISQTGKKYIENQYPFLRDKIIVSRIGTFDYGLNPENSSALVRILSCSNLVAVKRVDLIIKTLSYIKSSVKWVHFGDGSMMNEIKSLVSGLPANITAELRGAVGHNELMEFYRANPVDLFINVSSSEGVPVSVMEAMSFGIPVIATNVGGTSEIVSEKTGRLIDPGFSPVELAGEIEDLLAREDIKGLRTASRNQWEQISKADIVYPRFVEELLRV